MATVTTAALIDPAFQVPSTEYRDVPLAQLELSPLNPRKRFDPDRLAELAASMGNGVGVIAPLVVRAAVGTSRAEVRYEIVAGARRYKAAQLAGLARVPVSVRPLTDAQVLELMVIENDQRQDITPLEEADGFARLMTFGFDFDKLAARIGRSRRYIFDAVKLLDLVDDAKALLEQGIITRAHAVLLSRETPADQRRAIALTRSGAGGRVDSPLFEREDTLFTPAEADAHGAEQKANRYAGYKAKTVRELEAWIHAHCRFEASTPVAAELFPQTAAAVQAPDAKVVAISYAHHTHPDAKAGLTTRIYSVTSWKRADGQQRSRTCAYAVTGMVVAGAGRGESFPVCVNKDRCKTHWAADIKRREVKQKAEARTPTPAKAPAAADKRAAAKRAKEEAEQRARALANARRDQVDSIAIDRALEVVEEVTPRLLRWAVIAHAGFFDAVLTARFKALTHFKGNPYYLKVKDLEKLTAPTLARALFLVTLGGVMDSGESDAQVAALMKDLGVDVKAIDAEVAAKQKAAALPPPKPTPGTCRFCGCTDDHACPGGCSWLDREATVCSTKACRAAWTRERAPTTATMPAKAKAGKQR